MRKQLNWNFSSIWAIYWPACEIGCFANNERTGLLCALCVFKNRMLPNWNQLVFTLLTALVIHTYNIWKGDWLSFSSCEVGVLCCHRNQMNLFTTQKCTPFLPLVIHFKQFAVCKLLDIRIDCRFVQVGGSFLAQSVWYFMQTGTTTIAANYKLSLRLHIVCENLHIWFLTQNHWGFLSKNRWHFCNDTTEIPHAWHLLQWIHVKLIDSGDAMCPELIWCSLGGITDIIGTRCGSYQPHTQENLHLQKKCPPPKIFRRKNAHMWHSGICGNWISFFSWKVCGRCVQAKNLNRTYLFTLFGASQTAGLSDCSANKTSKKIYIFCLCVAFDQINKNYKPFRFILVVSPVRPTRAKTKPWR